MNIVIYVGFHKTGSTFLYNEIFNKMPYDLKVNPFYEKPTGDTIYCNEGLSGCEYNPKFNFMDRITIAENLKKLFPDAKIILGDRDTTSWMKSLYSQYIKEGFPHNYSYWYDNVLDKDAVLYKKEEYISLLNQLFKNVYVYNFDELRHDISTLVKNICEFIGCDTVKFSNKKYNVGWNNRQLKLGRWLNKWKPYNVRWLINNLNKN